MAQLIVSTIKLGMVNEMSKRFVQLVVFLIILMLPTQTIQAAHKTVVIDPGHGGDPHEKEEKKNTIDKQFLNVQMNGENNIRSVFPKGEDKVPRRK